MALDRPPIAAEIRATLAVAAPLAAANLAQMAMQVTNAVMVGDLGAVPLAAAGLGNALNATLLMTSQGLLTAVAPLAAHSIGAGDHPAAGRVAGGGLIVATAVAAPMMATLMVVPPLLSGLGYEPGLVAEIGRFLWAISWGIPGFLGAAVLRFLLIAAFRTRIVMIVPLLAVPLNLVLNWVLIFGHWGMPALGSAGSGWATAIVQWLTLFSFALYMLVAKAGISLSPGRGVLRQIKRGGCGPGSARAKERAEGGATGSGAASGTASACRRRLRKATASSPPTAITAICWRPAWTPRG